MSKRLLVAVSLGIMAARMAHGGVSPLEEQPLSELEAMVDRNDVSGLCDVASRNSCLIEDETLLAVALRKVMEANSVGDWDYSFQLAANKGKGIGRGYISVV